MRKLNIESAEKSYGEFLTHLGFDWKNDMNMISTPKRIVKSFVQDLFRGEYIELEDIKTFPNTESYDGMVFQGNIEVNSICSHHFLPFIGKAHIAYIPGTRIIGLSKLNRIVEHYSRRPQVQENLTMQIHNKINELCENNFGVAIVIECEHLCASLRGIKHQSKMKTAKLSGNFMDNPEVRKEFYDFIQTL